MNVLLSVIFLETSTHRLLPAQRSQRFLRCSAGRTYWPACHQANLRLHSRRAATLGNKRKAALGIREVRPPTLLLMGILVLELRE